MSSEYSVHSTPPPVCPRHRDRVAYVRCQRCDRPVCAECQHQAAVGVQCVDCVKSGRGPRLRNAFGAALRPDSRAVVTYTLIGINVIMYILQRVVDNWTGLWAFAPFAGQAEPWRFITSAFLHNPGSLLHILFNMYALYIVGPFLERALGRARFLALYALTAVAGNATMLLVASPGTGSWMTPVVGASGAVFGLFGAAMVVLHRIRQPFGQFLVILALNAVIGFVVPGIAWQAHAGGLVVGAILGWAWAYAPRQRIPLMKWLAPTIVAAVLIGIIVVKYAGA